MPILREAIRPSKASLFSASDRSVSRGSEHYWPFGEYPDFEVVHRTETSGQWCEFYETFAVTGVILRRPLESRCGQTADLRAIDRLMLTQPGDLHVDVPPFSVSSWQVVRVPRGVVEREAVKQGLTPPVVLGTRMSADPPAIAAFVDLHHLIRRGGSPLEIRALLSRCVGTLLAGCHQGVHRPATEHVSIRRARAYMRERLSSVGGLEELAKTVGVGKFQLIKLFRRQCGLPPRKYLMYMRVARAKSLLSQGLLCTDVAQETGFYDQSHLNRWFRNVYGLSPGAYLRQRQRAWSVVETEVA
jgi:AraC-like DNA-binding protein